MEMIVGNLYICPNEAIVMYLKENPFDTNCFYGIVVQTLDEGLPKGHFCREWNKKSFEIYNQKITIQNGKN